MSSVEYFDCKKGSHDTENHCCYFKILSSTETPSYENRLRQRLSLTKNLRFEPEDQPDTRLSLRPFMHINLSDLNTVCCICFLFLVAYILCFVQIKTTLGIFLTTDLHLRWNYCKRVDVICCNFVCAECKKYM